MITLRIKVWKRLRKFAPGRVRKGDSILVRLGKFRLVLLAI